MLRPTQLASTTSAQPGVQPPRRYLSQMNSVSTAKKPADISTSIVETSIEQRRVRITQYSSGMTATPAAMIGRARPRNQSMPSSATAIMHIYAPTASTSSVSRTQMNMPRMSSGGTNQTQSMAIAPPMKKDHQTSL